MKISIAKRKNPDINKKEKYFDLLYALSKKKDIYLSFTRLPKFGINPRSVFSTPLGLYTYNYRDSYKEYDTYLFEVEFPFPPIEARNFLFIMEAQKPILNVSDYSEKDFELSIQKLSTRFSMEQINQADTLFHKAPFFKEHLKKVFGARIYNILYYLSGSDKNGDIFPHTKKAPLVWSRLFISLGYFGFRDPHYGIIHKNERAQTVFFRKDSIKIIKTLQLQEFLLIEEEFSSLERGKAELISEFLQKRTLKELFHLAESVRLKKIIRSDYVKSLLQKKIHSRLKNSTLTPRMKRKVFNLVFSQTLPYFILKTIEDSVYFFLANLLILKDNTENTKEILYSDPYRHTELFSYIKENFPPKNTTEKIIYYKINNLLQEWISSLEEANLDDWDIDDDD